MVDKSEVFSVKERPNCTFHIESTTKLYICGAAAYAICQLDKLGFIDEYTSLSSLVRHPLEPYTKIPNHNVHKNLCGR